MKVFSARQIRELAFLTLYLKAFNPDYPLKECFAFLWDNRQELRPSLEKHQVLIDEWQEIAQQGQPEPASDLSFVASYGEWPTENIDRPEIPSAYEELVVGVLAKEQRLNEELAPCIEGRWSIDRLEDINRLLLHLAAYEMIFVSDEQVPDVVALNEALELAKRYTDEQAKKFINGVLAKLLETQKE